MNQVVLLVKIVEAQNVHNMVTVQLFYKFSSGFGEEVMKILDDLKKDSPVKFHQEEFNLESRVRKENFYAKKILTKYGTNQVPFLLFIDEKGEEYAALYNEHKSFEKQVIENLVRKGYERNLK